MSDRERDADSPRTPTAEQLRADIDSGRTQDKVAHPDPAAAPLASDAEAGGAPLTPEQRRMARDPRPMASPPRQPSRMPWLAAVIAIVIALVIAAVWLS